MDYKKTMEYLSILLDMEKNIYIQEKTIENLYAERNSLGIKNRIELPIPESASTDYFDYMVTTGFVFWIIGLIIIISAKWKDFWESSGIFAIIIVPIIAGIIALFIGLAGALIIGPFVAAHYKSKEQNNLDAQYKYQLDDHISYLNKMIDRNLLDGVEVYHSSFTDKQIETLEKYCMHRGLLMSGGSDCHGEKKKDRKLGMGYGNLNINKEIIQNWGI